MGVNVSIRPSIFAASSVMALGLLACSIETTPEGGDGDDAENLARSGDGLQRSASGLTPELYGPGSAWYNYASTTHALTPKDLVYIVKHGESLTLLELLDYYDERGESGFFSLRARTHDGEQWGEVIERDLDKSVKEEVVCLDVITLESTVCEQATIAMSTAWRPIVQAGFAVKEPAFYALSHYSQPEDEHVQIAATSAETIDDVALERDALEAIEPLASASMTPDDSLIGWMQDAPGEPIRTDAHLQITANMLAAQWALVDATQEDGQLEITIRARCQRLSLDDQQPFGDEEERATFILSTSSDYNAMLVQLCEPEAARPSLTPLEPENLPVSGRWPDTKSFDLILEHDRGRLAIRAAPANLVHNYTLATGEDDEQLLIPLPEMVQEYEDTL